MIKYRLSRAADQDIDDIWVYSVSQWSEKQAESYQRSLYEAFHLLASNPNLGRLAENHREGYRIFRVRSHLIFYRQEAENPVEIVRILHERMQSGDHL